MSFTVDLSSLDRTASGLDGHAGDLRDRVTQLVTAMTTVNWASAAATAFRSQADEMLGHMRHCADQLNQAAADLRRHAATARDRLAVVAAAARAADEAANDIEHAASSVGSEIAGAGSSIGGLFS